jgi:hypothetical protein
MGNRMASGREISYFDASKLPVWVEVWVRANCWKYASDFNERSRTGSPPLRYGAPE